MDLSVVVSNDSQDADWDRFVLDHEGGHYTQSALWSKVKEIQGWKTLRIIHRDEQDQILAGAQILWKKHLLGMRYGYITKGPLFIGHNHFLATNILRHIQEQCKILNIQFLALQLPNTYQDLEEILVEFGFYPSRQGDIEKPATIKIDIGVDEEQIFEQIRPNKRRWIRKSLQSPFIIREGTRKDLDFFYRIHVATGERGGFSMQNLSFFYHIWDIFYPRGMISLHLCECRGETIASSIVIGYKDIIEGYRRGWSGGYSKLYPNEALDWRVIRWAKERGYRWYDLGGIDKKLADIFLATGEIPAQMSNTYSAYKLHFSDCIEKYPQTYDYIYHPLIRFIYHTVMFFRPIKNLSMMIYEKWLRKR